MQSTCAQVTNPAMIAECQVVADPSKEGTTCMPADPAAPCSQYVSLPFLSWQSIFPGSLTSSSRHVCRSGVCTVEAANIAQPCNDATVPPPDDQPVCTKYVCAYLGGDNGGNCIPVADTTKVCDDGDLCTTNACAADVRNCVSTHPHTLYRRMAWAVALFRPLSPATLLQTAASLLPCAIPDRDSACPSLLMACLATGLPITSPSTRLTPATCLCASRAPACAPRTIAHAVRLIFSLLLVIANFVSV